MEICTKTSIVIIFLSSITLCQDISSFTESTSGDNQTLFPLMLGSEWLFTFNSTTHSEKITDTARINGLLYYGLSCDNGQPLEWFRKSNDSVFVVYSGNDTVENLLYTFDVNAGDSWNISNSNCRYGTKITLISKTETIISAAADTFDNCYHFLHSQNCMDAGIVESWFAKGIGRVKYTTENIWGMATYVLRSYVTVTSVKQNSSRLKTDDFVLYDSYPNPFNPTTTLKYEIHKRSYVTLQIYDLLGREVTTWVKKYQDPGMYNILWDASEFPSGIYFVRLNVNDLFRTKKLILVK